MHSGIFDLTGNDTICAVSTPPGRGGIAVVRVSGPKAIEAVGRLWRGKTLDSMPSHTARLGLLIDGEDILDQAVATVFRSPASYTGDDTVELSVHGSPYVQRRLLQLLTADSSLCRLAQPGEFTRRAFLAGKLDLPQAEAVADLIAASSRGAHRLASQQLGGALSRHIETLRQRLLELASLLELELDFSEEDVEFASRARLEEICSEAETLLKRLVDSYSTGQAIRDGLPVVIAGAPNAGKSTLLNLLLDDERAIVSDIPGTTRDIIEDTAEIRGILFRFVDTAGLRTDAADIVELQGMERARRRIDTAAIVLLLIDASTTPSDLTHQMQQWADMFAQADNEGPILIPVISKTDTVDTGRTASHIESWRSLSPTFPRSLAPLAHSATNPGDLDKLLDALSACAREIIDGTPADEILTNARHHTAALAALAALRLTRRALAEGLTPDLTAQHLRDALDALASLTGRISSPEILTTIFSRFCIGK